jgi:hypothetical protein
MLDAMTPEGEGEEVAEEVQRVGVTVVVSRVRLASAPGPCLATADAIVESQDGLMLEIHAISVLAAGERLTVRMPTWRAPDGRLLPCLTLPPVVFEIVCGLVLREYCILAGERRTWTRIPIAPRPDRAAPPRLAATTGGQEHHA